MVRFSADGTLVASAGVDAVRIWSVKSGRQLASREGYAYSARMSAAGDQLFVAENAQVARRYRIPMRSTSLANLPEIVRCRVPFRLLGGLILPSNGAATSCESQIFAQFAYKRSQ